ncbi:MAG TPA: hypothetical protein VIJ85_02430, partial [Rhizomicrobium sp.]
MELVGVSYRYDYHNFQMDLVFSIQWIAARKLRGLIWKTGKRFLVFAGRVRQTYRKQTDLG